MKSWALASCFFCVAASATPESVPQPPPWNVHVEVQMISLPMAEGARLATDLRRPDTFTAAEERLAALLATGEAKLLGWPTVETTTGTRATSESIAEIQYEGPINMGGCFTPPDWRPPPNIHDPRPTVPTFFETKNTGATLQVGASIGGPRHDIDLSLSARLVRFKAMQPPIGARTGGRYTRPEFSTMDVRTDLTLPNGGGMLLGIFVEKQAEPRMVFFILHAAALPQPAPIP